jgi:hypothetical protein
VAVVLEQHPHRVADCRLVIHDENARFHDCGSGRIVASSR